MEGRNQQGMSKFDTSGFLRLLLRRMSKPEVVRECRPTISLAELTHWCILPALGIILITSVLQKRKNKRSCSRPGIPVPVNLLDGDEDRLTYAAVFGCTVTNCLTLLEKAFISTNTPAWLYLVQALTSVTEMCINFYPFMTCISQKNSVVWSLVGALYSTLWFVVSLMSATQCVDTASFLIPLQTIVIQLPELTCLAYLMGIFCWRTAHACSMLTHSKYSLCCQEDGDEDFQLMKPHHALHVQRLLRGTKTNARSVQTTRSPVHKFISMFHYKWDPAFRYSPRIVATVVVALLCLYEVSVMCFIGVENGMSTLRRYLAEGDGDYGEVKVVYGQGVRGHITLFLDVLRVSWYVAFTISLLAMVTYVVNICVSYSCHYRSLLRGDYSFIAPTLRKMPSTDIMCNSFMYSGLQIAFIFWAFFLMTVVLIVYQLVIAYLLVLPFLGLASPSLLKPFWNVLPATGISMALFVLQVTVSKTLVLQAEPSDKGVSRILGKHLALDNRRFYHNMSYFLFFYYILLGLYCSLMRIVCGIGIGVVYLARLDRSGLVRGFEFWDRGYVAYIALLRLEAAHGHPVLVSFCHLLLSHIKKSKDALVMKRPDSRGRRRWLLAYTLIRNSGLCRHRRQTVGALTPEKNSLNACNS